MKEKPESQTEDKTVCETSINGAPEESGCCKPFCRVLTFEPCSFVWIKLIVAEACSHKQTISQWMKHTCAHAGSTWTSFSKVLHHWSDHCEPEGCWTLVHQGSGWAVILQSDDPPLRKQSPLNTYGTCRGPWPPELPAPARWDRSCSICPWVYLHRRTLRPAAAAAEAERGGQEAARAAPCLGQTATTSYW